MLQGDLAIMNLVKRNSIRLRGLIHNNGVTFNMRDGTLGILSEGHLPPVVNLSPILGDRFDTMELEVLGAL